MGDEKDGQTPETFDREYVEGLRSEAKTYRLKLRDVEKQVEDLTSKVKESKDKDKTEVQKIAEEKALLEAEVKSLRDSSAKLAVDTAIKIAAAQAKVIDPEAALALIDRSEIDYADGRVVGVDKALKALLKAKPYLQDGEKPAPPKPGAGGGPISAPKGSFEESLLGGLKGALAAKKMS